MKCFSVAVKFMRANFPNLKKENCFKKEEENQLISNRRNKNRKKE